MQCMHSGCLPGWRRKCADLPTLTRARAGRQWPVAKTDARIVFLASNFGSRTAWRRPTAKKYKIPVHIVLCGTVLQL